MNTTELMQLGRKQVKETDASLLRSEKIVNDTMAIGIQTAETLQGQTRQLEKARAGRGAGRPLRPSQPAGGGATRGSRRPAAGSAAGRRRLGLPHPWPARRSCWLTPAPAPAPPPCPPPPQVIDDLDEIHFTMKKARQVIRDMTRSLMTDKWVARGGWGVEGW